MIIWFLVAGGLLGLLMVAEEDMFAGAGPTYVNDTWYINSGTTWTEADSPYVLNASVYVYNGAKLTIEPGVIVKFNGNYKLSIGRYLNGAGDLDAVGTVDKPIIFTSFKDDEAGGDLNGDGGNSDPAKGDWDHIYFYDVNNDNVNRMEHCIIRYASEGIEFAESSVPISRCNVTDNTYGIYGKNLASSPTISNCNITNNTYGVYLEYTSGSFTLNDNLIRDNGYGIVASMAPAVSGNTIVNNSVWNAGESRFIPYDVCLKGSIKGDNTWHSSLSPYIVIGDIGVEAPHKLTIEAGTTLKFDNSQWDIYVAGKLTAIGEPGNMINFTSNRVNPAKGDWNNIRLDPSDPVYDDHNKLQYCRFEYGDEALYLTDSSPNLMDHNEFENNTYGIRMEGDSDPVTFSYNNFTRNTYPLDCSAHVPSLATSHLTGNSYDNITIAGNIQVDCTWPEAESPYLLRDNTYIQSGKKLTIEPGVVVKAFAGKMLSVGRYNAGGGDLWAVGTADKGIVFTSVKDDSVGGDSNRDGGLTTPAKSDWEQLYFYDLHNSNNNKLEYCTVRYSKEGLQFNEGENTISKCNITYNTHGVWGENLNSAPTIVNCNISNNTYGLYLKYTSTGFTLNSNLIRDNNYGLVCSIVPQDNGNTIVNNSIWSAGESRFVPYDVCLTGNIKADNTWYSSLSPYVVIGDVTIESPYLVTIEAGTTLKFDNSAYDLLVYGKLTALGEANSKINFTSNRKNPAREDWGRILLDPSSAGYDDNNKLQHCVIEYATTGVECSDSSPAVFDNNLVQKNKYGIKFEGNSDPAITNSNFSDNKYPIKCTAHIPDLSSDTVANNDYDHISLEGYMKDSATWPLSESPYVLSGDVTVENNRILTIEPGVTVKALALGYNIKIGRYNAGGAGLSAVGTKDDPITFTTNMAPPAKGKWDGLYFYEDWDSGASSNIPSVMKHCIVEYANYGITVDKDISDLTIKHCTIRENNRGIYFESEAKASVENNKITSNAYGIYFYGNTADGHIHNNDIYGNADHGIWVHRTPEVNGSDNYWGSANGPTHAGNPGGNGDKASDRLDYTPFETYYVNNVRPMAAAGGDQTVVWGNNVTLDGRASYDEEECPNGDDNGNKLVYDWNLSATYPTNQITLNDQTSPTPWFISKVNVTGTYTFTLTVKDPGNEWAVEDTINVYARAPYEPVELWINQENPGITADDTFTFNAGANDTYGNKNHTWTREWSVTDPGGNMQISGQYNKTAVYHPHKAGTWFVYCNYTGGGGGGGGYSGGAGGYHDHNRGNGGGGGSYNDEDFDELLGSIDDVL